MAGNIISCPPHRGPWSNGLGIFLEVFAAVGQHVSLLYTPPFTKDREGWIKDGSHR